jgi:Ca2+-binding EF-hand superfamily protein
MKFNSMKTNLSFILVAICLTFASSDSVAQETKAETLSGVVESVDGNKITVNHRRKSRTFTLHDKAKINYVSFLKAKKEIKPGFFIRAGVDSDGQCNQLWVTLPIPEAKLKPSAEMLTMTPTELHKMADSDGDGELSYVEYATAIYRSPKHGPVGFNKSDRDKSGTLNLKEFEHKLEEGIKWWKISRKTPAEWHAEADANSDGVLSKQEFVTFLGSTAHLDTFFKRADKDRSGDLSVADLASFIDSILR